MQKGIFITFEGCEGAGKSTQAKLLCAALEALGYEVVLTREPGGTPAGEKIRAVLLDRTHSELAAEVELLLFLASRSQLVNEVINPALGLGKVVICDRFHHSTLAYQGGARELDMPLVRRMNDFATGGLLPDLTLLLDLPAENGFKRKDKISTEQADRMEVQGEAFHSRVRKAFLELAKEEPERITVLNAEEAPDIIARNILEKVHPWLKKIQTA